NSSGENANDMRLEKTRILAKLSQKAASESLSEEEQALLDEVKASVEEDRAMYEGYLAQMDMMGPMLANIPTMVAAEIGKENYTEKDLEKWKAPAEKAQLKQIAINIANGELSEESLQKQKEQIRSEERRVGKECRS